MHLNPGRRKWDRLLKFGGATAGAQGGLEPQGGDGEKQRGRESLFSRWLLQVVEIPWIGDAHRTIVPG